MQCGQDSYVDHSSESSALRYGIVAVSCHIRNAGVETVRQKLSQVHEVSPSHIDFLAGQMIISHITKREPTT
jgi:hypothetical protein